MMVFLVQIDFSVPPMIGFYKHLIFLFVHEAHVSFCDQVLKVLRDMVAKMRTCLVTAVVVLPLLGRRWIRCICNRIN